jgi:leukotriene B4 12-hydroxydehydrogenase/15-oxo-prostaglandin 13-reductase
VTNRQFRLACRPVGFPTEENFQLAESAVPPIEDGEVLVRVQYLSVDPYMRGRMSDAKSYAEPVALGETMIGGGVGRVIESRAPEVSPGDIITGMLGWQEYAVCRAKHVRKLGPQEPPTAALGPLGMPGLTAYFGLLDLCQPKAGETVLVSGAAGAVGSYVGQIAKIQGCRVAGIAGGPEKVRRLTGELGFDAAYDYKDVASHSAAIKEMCPAGVDCYFDNVGGPITDAALTRMNTFGRIAICGQISQYNNTAVEMGPRPFVQILARQLRVEGFIVSRYFPRAKEARDQMLSWILDGRLRYLETIVEGFENTPRAFFGVLRGENTGKMLVRFGE